MHSFSNIRITLRCLLAFAVLIGLSNVTTTQAQLAAHRVMPEESILQEIRQADRSVSFEHLADLIKRAELCCSNSSEVTSALTAWMRENHPIYQGKGSLVVTQFRAFLMTRLAQFPPHADLLLVVVSELEFGHSLSSVAAAAVAARSFPGDAPTLVPLLNRYLRADLIDELVDLSTYQLLFPIRQPTKARYEVIRTIRGFGDQARSALPFLEEMLRYEVAREGIRDDLLIKLSRGAIMNLQGRLPSCCQRPTAVTTPTTVTTVSAPSYMATLRESFPYAPALRQKIQTRGLQFSDQDGRQVRFGQLQGKPFVLTFFYTKCTNPLKCASTLRRLGDLQEQLIQVDSSAYFGVYAISYDAVLDNPLVMKSYGDAYGLDFRVPQTKLLTASDGSEQELFQRLNVRVGYGHGTINQHGVQLFVFDRQGRIAAEFDNQVWTVDEVYGILRTLEAE